MSRRFHVPIGFLLLSLALAMVSFPPAAPIAVAQDEENSFYLILSYTDVTVGPGQDFAMDVDVVNPRKEPVLVNLQTESVPEDWEAAFHSRYPSFPVRSVMVKGEDTKTLELKVQVPDNVEGESFTMRVSASDRQGGSRQSETVTFRLVAEKVETGGLVVESQYPELTGPSNQTFNFSVDLKNETDRDLTTAVAVQAPSGWRARVKPQFEDNIISSVALKQDASQTLSIEVEAPALAEAGEYPITFTALSGPFKAEKQFKAILTGTYEFVMGVPTLGDRLALKLNTSVQVGRESEEEFLIANTGTAPLANLTFESTKPEGWSVEFEPEKIDAIDPGQFRNVVASIQTADRTIAGDYLLTITAKSPDATRSIDFRVTAATPTLWGWIGALIVALVVIGLAVVFYRLGRR